MVRVVSLLVNSYFRLVLPQITATLEKIFFLTLKILEHDPKQEDFGGEWKPEERTGYMSHFYGFYPRTSQQSN